MEMSLIILAWIIFSAVQIIAERQRRPTSNPPPGIDFDIPTLANDPNQPAEVHEVNLAQLYRQRKAEKVSQQPAKVQAQPVEEVPPAIDMQAIILAEILDKPKALRRR